ncbi:hypothetical protein A5893_00275 [Pedobacter psychrophilus]|uniref:Uncharacterized protein n=1 Tax=Pedobacter psychrophilus TaxID=1826909 RepID=A0A179DKU2_9SPHI|nr:hypothetical protein [Pedobacter psychrophilus]OAQ41588.1 hypothetical protein A5893_00275 [Pedobacter psychrophilus]
MKNIIIIFLIFNFYAISQSKAQVNAYAWQVKSEYLQNGKILINNSTPSTTIKYDLSFAKNNGSGTVKTRLVTFNQSGVKIDLTNQTTVSASDFPPNVTIITKTYEVDLQKNLLDGNPIYLGVQLGSNTEGLYTNGSTKYNYIIPPAPPLIPPITINAVNKVETILFGTDCGLAHAYGVSYNPRGHMENGVWKFAYEVSFTKNNSNISDDDVFWEWVVSDFSNYPVTEKQFLVYPYGTDKTVVMNGEKKVTVEANDYLDEYDSVVKVRAKSRSTGSILSSDFTFYFTAVNH